MNNGEPPVFHSLNSVTAGLVAFLVQFLPLLVLVGAAELTGGAGKWIGGKLKNVGNKAQESFKGNPNDPNSLRNRVRFNARAGATRAQAKVVDQGRELGASRFQRARGKMARVAWRNMDERMAQLTKQDRERQDTMSSTGRDQLRYAGGGWMLKAGDKAPDFVQDGAGTTENYDRYYNSKGKEISKSLYSEGKASYGGNLQSTANSLNWAARKIQTDQDIANFRHAFAQNAIANNWDNSEAGDAWAAATYEYKPQLSSEWYSRPEVVRGANGRTTGVKYNDISNDEKAFHSFMTENHKSRESFKLSSMRDSEWRATADRMAQFQAKVDRGEAVTQKELEGYAMASEVVDSVVKEGYASGTMSQDAEGNLQVQGPNSAAQGVLNAMYKNRKYAVSAYKDASGRYSVHERVLYDKSKVDAERQTRITENQRRERAGQPSLGAFDEYSSIDKHALRQVGTSMTNPKNVVLRETPGDKTYNTHRVEVTGDEQRSLVPR